MLKHLFLQWKLNCFFAWLESNCPRILYWYQLMRALPWSCAQGHSLKIPALPSVTTLSFRSHMFLKKQQGLNECNHNIFLSPFLALCAPETAFSCIWMAAGEHNVMRKWRTQQETQKDIAVIWYRLYEPGNCLFIYLFFCSCCLDWVLFSWLPFFLRLLRNSVLGVYSYSDDNYLKGRGTITKCKVKLPDC